MPKSHLPRLSLLVFCALLLSQRANADESSVLFSFTDGFDLGQIVSQDATPDIVQVGDGTMLEVRTGHAARWPGITLRAPQGDWDLSAYNQITLPIRNAAAERVAIHCRVDCPGGDGAKNSVTHRVELAPGQQLLLSVPLRRKLPAALADKLFGMRGYPGGYGKDDGLDVSRITQLIVFVSEPKQDHLFQIGDITACGQHDQGRWTAMTPDEFFPMIDRFGQFIHKDWPGKTLSDESLVRAIATEQADWTAHPGPSDWNQFGGWQAGPQLAATGFFRAEKRDGQWWLVDPEGRLFWSHGADCVDFSQGTTPISDREFYFADLPSAESPHAAFFGKGAWAPHGYYQGKGTYRTYNFMGANLLRKYGADWHRQAAEASHRRLRSWSMNTIANWSDERVFLMRRTPYVVSAGTSGAKRIAGSSGYWGQFPDPFDPSLREALARRMRGELGKSAGDPWCIGYFVDNELGWGDELSLAIAALASPSEQAAKQAFLADLRDRYATIEQLNAQWGTTHADWAALEACQTPPDRARARDDLARFYTRIAEEYFRICREVVKDLAPDQLYLGCRFAWVNDRGARAAAKYCDVIGYNLYEDSVADFRLPPDVDMPVIIGEFHFGALDRGMFHTGLRPTASQQDRAEAYRNYVTGALQNPCLVGTHWFQYSDQATTGRGDGENYQIGLVDICDNPYPETIRVVREVGNAMYTTRMAARQASTP